MTKPFISLVRARTKLGHAKAKRVKVQVASIDAPVRLVTWLCHV